MNNEDLKYWYWNQGLEYWNFTGWRKKNKDDHENKKYITKKKAIMKINEYNNYETDCKLDLLQDFDRIRSEI